MRDLEQRELGAVIDIAEARRRARSRHEAPPTIYYSPRFVPESEPPSRFGMFLVCAVVVVFALVGLLSMIFGSTALSAEPLIVRSYLAPKPAFYRFAGNDITEACTITEQGAISGPAWGWCLATEVQQVVQGVPWVRWPR